MLFFFGLGRITIHSYIATLYSRTKINHSHQANISTQTFKYGEKSMLYFSDDTEATIINSSINGNSVFIKGTLLTNAFSWSSAGSYLALVLSVTANISTYAIDID